MAITKIIAPIFTLSLLLLAGCGAGETWNQPSAAISPKKILVVGIMGVDGQETQGFNEVFWDELNKCGIAEDAVYKKVSLGLSPGEVNDVNFNAAIQQKMADFNPDAVLEIQSVWNRFAVSQSIFSSASDTSTGRGMDSKYDLALTDLRLKKVVWSAKGILNVAGLMGDSRPEFAQRIIQHIKSSGAISSCAGSN